MATPIQRIQTIIDEVDIDTFLNAVQQVCFCQAADQREIEGDTVEADYWLDIGKKLSPAIEAASVANFICRTGRTEPKKT